MELNKQCESCHKRLNLWSLFVSLFLSLVKGVIGILGSSESLVADGLYSFYQSFVALKSILLTNRNKESSAIYKSVWFAGLVIAIMLILGIGDVLIFSLVRIAKATKGLLVRPSPYALYTAILSVLANQLLYRYSLCLKKEMPEKNGSAMEMAQNFRLSVIVSSIVIIGIAISRTVSLYGDAIAALILGIMLVPKVINLFNQSWRITTEWTSYRIRGTQSIGESH